MAPAGAAADAINHAIPTIEEVEHAIQFLGAASLVRYSDTSLRLTEEGRRICRRTETKDIFITLDRLHAFLKTLPMVTTVPRSSPTAMRPDQLDRRLREHLDALGPAPRAELLRV